jgi:tetratricopeptide (TPR) repeat protein
LPEITYYLLVKRILPTLLLLLLAGTLSAQPMDDHAFAQQYTIARVHEENHDWDNALRLYVDLHKARPDAFEISEALFRVLYTTKKYSAADSILLEVIARKQASFDVYMKLAQVRSRLNKKAEALAAFEEALKFPNQYGHYSSLMTVTQAMIEMGYQEEALALLEKERKIGDEGDQVTREIASLEYKMGRYEDGTREYLAMLRRDEQTLSQIEQRIAQFTADTSVRKSIMQVVTSHIAIEKATPAELRLLGWCDEELKNYKGSLDIFLRLDNLGIKASSASAGGYELYNFAERVRKEGAFDVASQAYTEAIRRFHQGAGTDPQRKNFVAMAELGSIETKEAYLRSLADPPHDSLAGLLNEYQQFAAVQPNDLAFEALLHAGDLSCKVLRNFSTANKIYEDIISRSQSYNERTRDAYFALEEIALAQGDIPLALSRLSTISGILQTRKRPEDAEVKKHILFEKARIDYFSGNFDTCLAKLDTIIADPNSDYANDAIGLHSLVSENRGNAAALKLFAKAEMTALGNDLNAALSAYRSIPETYPTATIADESVLRAVEILIQLKKPADALAMLATMQEKMTTSPLLDKAAFREAEITELIIKDKAKALRMYEDLLERFPKSPLCTVARRKARTLRGDSF